MEFREIIELAKKRGLSSGKATKRDIIEAFESDIVYSRDDITLEDVAGEGGKGPTVNLESRLVKVTKTEKET